MTSPRSRSGVSTPMTRTATRSPVSRVGSIDSLGMTKGRTTKWHSRPSRTRPSTTRTPTSTYQGRTPRCSVLTTGVSLGTSRERDEPDGRRNPAGARGAGTAAAVTLQHRVQLGPQRGQLRLVDEHLALLEAALLLPDERPAHLAVDPAVQPAGVVVHVVVGEPQRVGELLGVVDRAHRHPGVRSRFLLDLGRGPDPAAPVAEPGVRD